MQKQGLLTACKYKNFCTRQKRLAKEKNNDVCKLVKETVTVETDIPQVNDSSVTSPREWGLINKEKAACLEKNFFSFGILFSLYTSLKTFAMELAGRVRVRGEWK